MVNSKSNLSFLKPVSGARSQKEGVDVDLSESKGVTNGGNGEDFWSHKYFLIMNLNPKNTGRG